MFPLLLLSAAMLAQHGTDVSVLPSRITLASPVNWQRLIVEAKQGELYTGDLTSNATFTSANQKVAMISKDGIVKGIGNGKTTITARVGNRTAKVPIVVQIRNPQSEIRNPNWSFRNHVLPVMTRAGCNSGACHGASAGKGGLKLTLRGFDPLTDYFTLTRQAWARRVNRMNPAQSLMLLKPTGDLPHGGGVRFRKDSVEYRVILDWIANGAPPPMESDPSIQQLEVIPKEASLRIGSSQQVLVRAHFSDGHMEDVTRWVKFNSNDTAVASVDDSGKVTVAGPGEAAITIWYASKVAFATVTVPYLRK